MGGLVLSAMLNMELRPELSEEHTEDYRYGEASKTISSSFTSLQLTVFKVWKCSQPPRKWTQEEMQPNSDGKNSAEVKKSQRSIQKS